MHEIFDVYVKVLSAVRLKFNGEKCIAVECGKTLYSPKCLKLCISDLPWSKELCYLGISFIIDYDLKADLTTRIRIFTGAVYELCVNIGRIL